MLFYALTLLLIVIHFITLGMRDVGDNTILILACFPFIVSFIVSAFYYFHQAESLEKITEYKDKKEIEKKEAEALTAELKLHLTQNYPDFEKEIFEKIKPQNVSIHITKYPELQSSKTILEYVKSIRIFQKHIFDCDRMIAELNRQIRIRKRTCKLFCIPVLPK